MLRNLFEKHFYTNYRSIIVLANPKTVLNAKYAKKEVRNQVIRADQLAEHIRRINADPEAVASSEKDMESLAQFFCGYTQTTQGRLHRKIQKPGKSTGFAGFYGVLIKSKRTNKHRYNPLPEVRRPYD